MIGKFFIKKNSSTEDLKMHEVDVALRLMFEIAISDGSLDSSELEIIKKRAAKFVSKEEKISTIIKKIIDESTESVSLYPTVKRINETHSNDEKKELLQILWELVKADSIVDAYEENLYFKIAELIHIKRSIANQIKQKNS